MEKILIVLAIAVLFGAGGLFTRYNLNLSAANGQKTSTSAPNSIDIGTTTVEVEYARTTEEQRVGLMNRKDLGEHSGMYFVFTMPLPRAFWNQNTLIPLDVIWIRKNVVIGVSELPAISNGLTIVNSPGLADRVLEVNRGFATRFHIEKGSIVKE